MISKLFNWVGGGFFRTLGRFLAFIALGFLASVIISKNDIKWTDLLGIETVKAMSLDGVYYGQRNVNSSQFQWNFYKTDSVDYTKKGYNFGTPFNSGDADYVQFNLLSLLEIEDINTFQEHSGTSGSYTYTYQFNNSTFYLLHPRIQLMSNGAWQTCELQNNLIVCPTFHNVTYTGLYFEITLPSSNIYQKPMWTLTVNNYCNLYTTATNSIIQSQENNTQSIINSQTQQHNETISTITDTNTTEADTQATNFFSNFSSQDNGGISSIITAPLQAISGLVSATCNQIVLPIPYLDNKQLVLPCMSTIYTEHFGAFFTIYQTIIFGAIAYRMLVSIFMMIQGFKNPDDDKIEVVDL